MRKRKLIVSVVAAVVILSAAAYGLFVRDRGIIAAQAGRVIRQDLTQVVTANGEIRPKKYVNISSNIMGRIVEMPASEGGYVDQGDLLIRLESIQTEAEVMAAESSLEAAEAELEAMDASIRSSEAALNSARAELSRTEADFNRVQQNFQRAQRMSGDGLISREQFDRSKAEFEVASAQINAAGARLEQAEAQLAQVRKQKDGVGLRIAQQRSALIRARDQLGKTTIRSPLEGIITHLPVNVGEIAIVGVQNQPGTVLMTIADMSVITAELRVDETDIVSVRPGQPAEVRVDALNGRTVTGYVSEVGNSALTRTGALTTGAPATQEAKDFKVVITLDNPPLELRPGLSCTATIVTAQREQVLTVPIQALTIREVEKALPAGETGVALTAESDLTQNPEKVEKEGVFVIENGVAFFREIEIGIAGTTDIEVTEGLTENQQIVTGSFQVLRTLKTNTPVRIDTQP